MPNQVEQLLSQLSSAPKSVDFTHVIEVITAHYDYTPTRFTNGEGKNQVVNEAGTNEGSCKIFGFAQLHKLDKQQTLACFGHYYREDVLLNPEGGDHGNIRNFMRTAWDGIQFDMAPLQTK